MSFLPNPSTIRRGLPVAACVLALFATTAVAQDGDDDGVLPKHSSDNSNSSTPAAVGVSMAAPASDAIDPTEAMLSITDLVGPTVLDTTVAPADAMFVASGPVNYEITDVSVGLQASGLLGLPAGYAVKFNAPQAAAARAALLVVHPADVGLEALLSGAVAPTFIVPVGDLPTADLAQLQDLVSHHAGALPGLAVSLVYVSLDTTGALHVAAARITTDGAPIEIVVH